MVQEISAASGEQFSGMVLISDIMSKLDSLSLSTAASSEELLATAEDMGVQAKNLLGSPVFS